MIIMFQNFKNRFYGGYSLDVISSCCFGVDANSIKDPNNEFIKHLRKLTTRSTFQIIKILFMSKC